MTSEGVLLLRVREPALEGGYVLRRHNTTESRPERAGVTSGGVLQLGAKESALEGCYGLRRHNTTESRPEKTVCDLRRRTLAGSLGSDLIRLVCLQEVYLGREPTLEGWCGLRGLTAGQETESRS